MSTLQIENGQSSVHSDSECSRDSTSSSNKRRALVQHNYHDHANVVCNSNLAFVTRGGVSTVFPLKLYHMLLHAEADGITDIVGWQPHGRAFVVRKPKEFAASVLPRYFGKMKFASFQRQLNLYGFLRLTQGQDKGGYYHELFLRNREFLCVRIQRMRVKGTGARAASNPSAEPDLYSLPPVSEQPLTTAPVSQQPQAIPSAVVVMPVQQVQVEPVDYSSSSDEESVVDMNILSEFLLDKDETPPKINARPQLSHQGSISSLCSEDSDATALSSDHGAPLLQTPTIPVAPQQQEQLTFPSKLPTLDMEELCFLQSLFGTKDVEAETSFGAGNANNATSAIHTSSGRRRTSIRRSLIGRAA